MSSAGSNTYRYLYGPVPSRRLGRSLGVDIVPYKVCSYDCIYCQLGRTTRLTAAPEQLVSAADVISEIENWIGGNGSADYITFAGSGEPTLNIELGEMIQATRKLTDIPVAVITNGSLLGLPDVYDAVSKADVLLPSLDAGSEATFLKINRPPAEVRFFGMTEGLVQAAQAFSGSFWLEVMLVAGVNDSDAELHAIREIVRRICPDRIQVNTVERPSRSGEAKRVDEDRLTTACSMLGGLAEAITSDMVSELDSVGRQQIEDEVLRLLSRRPCTLEDLVVVSGRNRLEIEKYLRSLVHKGLVEEVGVADPYYRCVTGG